MASMKTLKTLNVVELFNNLVFQIFSFKEDNFNDARSCFRKLIEEHEYDNDDDSSKVSEYTNEEIEDFMSASDDRSNCYDDDNGYKIQFVVSTVPVKTV